jgi:hypothetical protein
VPSPPAPIAGPTPSSITRCAPHTPQCTTLNTWRRSDCFKCSWHRGPNSVAVPLPANRPDKAMTAEQVTTDVPGRILVLLGVPVTATKEAVRDTLVVGA